MSGRPILFVDRDGTLIEEPGDFQIDAYPKLRFVKDVLLQSTGFASPRDAGQRIAAIKQGEIGDGASDFALGEGVTDEEVNAALAAFVAAQLEGEGQA